MLNDQKKKGKLLIFSAPSGTGKTTIIKELMKKFSELKFSISATTRKPRGDEKNGVEYFFLTKEDFQEKIKTEEFVEYKNVYENYYGTLKSYVDKSLKEGKNIIFDVDVQGALEIKKEYPDDSIMIFIYPPSIEDLKVRLEMRGTDSSEIIEKRLKYAKKELDQMDRYDHKVKNEKIDDAVYEITNILKKIDIN
ncbi:MAG: guanylate kinase [Candidatus Delongbacteria bacterium]|nr:guanylate kinase [Candidatus Delongbacteria bacterium]